MTVSSTARSTPQKSPAGSPAGSASGSPSLTLFQAAAMKGIAHKSAQKVKV